MRVRAIVLLALTVSLSTLPAVSATFRPGDIIVSTSMDNPPDQFGFTGRIRQFAPDGTLIQEFFSSGVTGAADLKFSPDGILHGAAGQVIFRFANDGTMLAPLQAPSPAYFLVSLAFARSGDLYATTYDGRVLKFGRDGSAPVVVSAQTSSLTWADLDIDQCTLYRFRAEIGRLNVCTNTVLAPLPTQLGVLGRTLLVLPDGTLLASTAQSDMYRIATDGTVLRHYATHAIAFSRDLSSNFVWVSLGSQFAKFDLQNDVIAAGPFDTGAGEVGGIAIVGADVAAIPALSPILLALLALAVATSAIVRLRM